MISITVLSIFIRHSGDKTEEEQLFEWIERARHSKTSKITNHEHASFPRNLYDWVFFLIRFLTLRSSTEEISRWKLKVLHRGKKKAWIERNWNIECRFSENNAIFSISKFGLKFLNLKLQSSNDERSNINSDLCCTIHVQINHLFYQLQMMMKMTIRAIVVNWTYISF